MGFVRSCVSADGRLLGQSTAPAKRSSNEAARDSIATPSADEARPVVEVASADCLSLSSLANAKTAWVSRLATRNLRLSGICDPREAEEPEAEESNG